MCVPTRRVLKDETEIKKKSPSGQGEVMKLEQFKNKITRPDFTDHDKEALFLYGKDEAGYVDSEEWEVFLEEINEEEWEVNPLDLDPDDDSDVEVVEVTEGRRLVRIA